MQARPRTRWTSVLALVLAFASTEGPVRAQSRGPETVPFFDTNRKPDRPDLAGIRAIRFLTDDDYPPFHFPGPDGQLTGFNVDLARAICVELKVACTIQPRRWDTLVASLEEGRGDAVIASLSASETTRARVDFGIPYYRSPGRFLTRKDTGLKEVGPASLKGKSVVAVSGSSHAAFLATFFPAVRLLTAPDPGEVYRILTSGQADAAFGDGVGFAIWLNSENGANCCTFVGGSYFETRFFGEGAAIAFRKDSSQLRRAVDFALFRLAETGVYQSIMLKYFPVSFY